MLIAAARTDHKYTFQREGWHRSLRLHPRRWCRAQTRERWQGSEKWWGLNCLLSAGPWWTQACHLSFEKGSPNQEWGLMHCRERGPGILGSRSRNQEEDLEAMQAEQEELRPARWADMEDTQRCSASDIAGTRTLTPETWWPLHGSEQKGVESTPGYCAGRWHESGGSCHHPGRCGLCSSDQRLRGEVAFWVYFEDWHSERHYAPPNSCREVGGISLNWDLT